jgi:hypothetical protein
VRLKRDARSHRLGASNGKENEERKKGWEK